MDFKDKIVGISGIGLMGGSLAAAIKKYLPGTTIIGYDNDTSSARNALSNSLIDEVKITFDELVNSVDILFLAAPTSSILSQIKTLHSYTRRLIISDVCSVKRPIVKAAETLTGNMVFIGGHPMAGSQKIGNEYANPDLFLEKPYALCPPVTGTIPDVIMTIVNAIGAFPVILAPEEHDRSVSQISHLPQLLAVALLNDLIVTQDNDEYAYRLAAGGFKDVTRIGESSFSVWEDILKSNRDNLNIDIGRLVGRLQKYKELLARNEFEILGQEFENAGFVRKKISKK